MGFRVHPALGPASLLGALTLAIGCNDGSDAATPSASAQASASASAASVDFAPLPTASPKPEGPSRWVDFPGKPTDVELSGPHQWAAVPVSRNWDSLKMARLAYDGRKGDEHSFDGGKLFVPSAFVHEERAPEDLKPGTPVRVSMHGTAAPGRIVSVDGAQASVNVEWIDEVKLEQIALTELLVLGDSDPFGDPIAYEDEGVSRHGVLVHRSEPTSWIVAWGGQPKEVPTKSIRPVSVERVFTVGDRVMATFVGRFTSATVLRVESNGVRYEVDRKEGGAETLAFTEVTAPPG